MSAAIFAALSLCGARTLAQNITLQSADGGVVVSGDFLAFDGEVLTMRTVSGVSSLRTEGIVCDGDACPTDPYVPTLRLTGPRQLSDLLLPALVEAYARDQGFSLSVEAGKMELADSGAVRLRISIQQSTVSTGLERMIAGDADMLLSSRDMHSSELRDARAAGLGALDQPRQSRIIALDALVPVVGAGSSQRGISLRSLVDILTGQISDWSDLNDRDGSIAVHLLGPDHGVTDAFIDRYLNELGSHLRADIVWHATPGSLQAALNESEGGIGLLPVSVTGATQPLALAGSCGVQAHARFVALKTEDYPLTFPLYLYAPGWRQHPEIRAFQNWLRSASAQLVVRRAGLADLAGVPIPLAEQGQRLANAITAAGGEVSLDELQRMVRVLSPRVRMSSTFRFQPGSTRLDGPSQSNLMLVAQAIQNGEYMGREIILVGFSDGRGPALANRDLASARAESVKRELLRALGGELPFNVTLETEAFGEAMPIACDDTLWGQQTNRRVEFWVRDLPAD